LPTIAEVMRPQQCSALPTSQTEVGSTALRG
jgi:hypothetical protein